jgi:hypothetical protein
MLGFHLVLNSFILLFIINYLIYLFILIYYLFNLFIILSLITNKLILLKQAKFNLIIVGHNLVEFSIFNTFSVLFLYKKKFLYNFPIQLLYN